MRALAIRLCRSTLVAGAIAAPGLAAAQAAEVDPLSLESTAPATETTQGSPLRMSIEAAYGRIERRLPSDSLDGRRVSLDLRYNAKVNDALRVGLSDRIDDTHPALFDQRETINSLREAFMGWQADTMSAEFGRINLRQGPAFGFNPTDYFRTGGLRTVTTVDPVTLREMRMGAVMLRGAYAWAGGGATLVVAPKLATGPDARPGSLDLGATNARHRAMAAVDWRFSERASGQASVLLERGSSPRLGLSGTALVSGSLVAYGEWSRGRQPTLLDQALSRSVPEQRLNQAAVGATYTLPTSTSVTLELEHNGAGLDGTGWSSLLAAGPGAYGRFVSITQPSQELGSRRAWLLYMNHKGMGLKQLDLTAFVRTNVGDHSRLGWAELRYHWKRFDVALQWQRSSGDAARSEFGVMPYKQVVQLLMAFYL